MYPEQADHFVDVYRMVLLPEILGFEGFCSASLLVDRPSGYAVSSVTHAAYPQFDGCGARAGRPASQRRGPRGGEFELALAHLRVPEMA